MTRVRATLFTTLFSLAAAGTSAQTVLDAPGVQYRDSGAPVVVRRAEPPQPVTGNPYRGIHDLFPVTVSDQELCVQALAGYSTRRQEIERSVADAEQSAAAVDEEFLRSCDPRLLRPSERADCLLAHRLRREHWEREVAKRRENLERLDQVEAAEQARCAALPRDMDQRSQPDVAVEISDRLPDDPAEVLASIELERLEAFRRTLERAPEARPVWSVTLIGSRREVERALASLDLRD